MRILVLMIKIGVYFAVMNHGTSAVAHSPYYSRAEVISAPGYENALIKLLHGDGIFFADPMRAVVVDQGGTLLAVSPLSLTLRIVCKGIDTGRRCVAYDLLSRTIYEPRPERWWDAGVQEEEGRPLQYPEFMESEFGFVERAANAAETASFEIKIALRSWRSTLVAVGWWTLFWVLVMPVARVLLGGRRGLSLVSAVLRLGGATLMVLLTAWFWLLGPYSVFYLTLVVIFGAMNGLLITRIRRTHTA